MQKNCFHWENIIKTTGLLSENAKLLNEKKRIILDNKTATFYALQTVEERLQKSEIDLIKRISITLENRNIRSKEQSSHKLHRKNRSRERCYPLLP